MRHAVLHFTEARIKGEALPLQAEFPDAPGTLVIFMCPTNLDLRAEHFNAFLMNYRSADVLGVSTSGNIADDEIGEDFVSVTFMHFERTPTLVKTVKVNPPGPGATSWEARAQPSKEAGRLLASQVMGDDLSGVLLFVDGLSGIGVEIAKGFTDRIPKPWKFQISGAASGRVGSTEPSWIYYGGKFHIGVAVAIGFYGPHVVFTAGFGFGWNATGLWKEITSVRENGEIETINRRSALDAYIRHMGADGPNAPDLCWKYPVFIIPGSMFKSRYLRGVMDVSLDSRSFRVFGDPQSGTTIQMCRASADDLLGAVQTAVDECRHSDQLHDAAPEAATDLPGLLLMMSCKGRKRILGDRAGEERDLARAALPATQNVVGFYSYGEYTADYHSGLEMHTHSLSLIYISERPVETLERREES
jgi:hypothetical protein